ncbi:MAG: glycosyltransferase [Mycobacteriaceae bacterium]
MLAEVVRAGSLIACAGLLNSMVNHRVLLRPRPVAKTVTERVTVCVPARNEEHHVPQLLADLAAQTSVPRMRVLVLDDSSGDDTFKAAVDASAGDPRVRVERCTIEPSAGWLGKPAACFRLAELALADDQAEPDVLVFVDADVRLSPDAIAAGVGLLRNGGLDMVCPWPQQRADSIAERLVQPLQQWSWMTSLPLDIADRSHRPSMAAVCGQFLVVDSAAYRAIGGHSAVATCVLDDLELARALRRKGFRTAPADGSRLAQCRMYTGAGELRAGYGKSLWTAFGSPLEATALFTALVAIYVLPPAVALVGSGHARRWGLLGYLAAVGSRLVSAREAGTQSWPDVLAQPLSVLALAALTVDSHRQRRRGSLYWKGRHLA